MTREIQQRLQWVKLFEELGNTGFVYRRCGISGPTLRKWWRRYQKSGEAGLESGLPKQPIPKPMSSPGLLAHIAVSKYQDALPLYQQETILTA